MQKKADWEVLFVSHKYPPAIGGMEKQSYELIHGMEKYCKVHKIVYRKDKESLLMFFLFLNRRILKIIKENPNIQVIHFNDGLIAALSLFHSGYEICRKVVTLHGLDVVFPLAYFQNKILPRFNYMFDKVITVSEATSKAAIERGIYPDLTCCIANGVDSALISPSIHNRHELNRRYPQIDPNIPYMVTLGRPVKRKGFSWLLREVIPYMPSDFRLYMVGPFNRKPRFSDFLMRLLPKKFRHLVELFLGYPSDEAEIRRLLKRDDIAHKVVHLGKLPADDLKLVLEHSTAFLMPNISVPGDMEGFGLVGLEASMSGTFVFASALEGITSAIYDGCNGFLLPAENPQAWVRRLRQHLKMMAKNYGDHKGRLIQANNTKRFFNWQIMCEDYFEVFDYLADDENDPYLASGSNLLPGLKREKD